MNWHGFGEFGWNDPYDTVSLEYMVQISSAKTGYDYCCK